MLCTYSKELLGCLPTKLCLVKAMVFPAIMYGCESWIIKQVEWQRIDVFKLGCWRRLLDCKEIKPVHPKGNQSWIFIGRTDAEAPILWPPDEKNRHIGKDPDAGKDWRQEEKGMTEDKMIEWHHWLNGHEFEQAAGLAFCSPWDHKESDTTEQQHYLTFTKKRKQWDLVALLDFEWNENNIF